MTDFRINGSTVHLEGCLWASRRTSRSWFGSGNSSRKQASDALRRRGLTACPDCRPLDTLTDLRPEGATRG